MKNKTLRSHLLLTQEEMAHLLGVSRGHYSMYELGRRDLPVSALQIAAELSVSLGISGKFPKEKLSAPAPTKQHVAEEQRLIARLLNENDYQRTLVARKIATVEKAQTAARRISELQDYLKKRASKNPNPTPIAFSTDKKKKSAAGADANLIALRLRQEWLETEKKFLESKSRG
ncbi:helix-turn-helix transcriptional regulator [Flavobacterium selenitireducens]|uniref:helix-turn-helix transcriptional regulator n=1 Tax=Flavobacterium selenitireducens TaxID=2722704 RepID=UPI00168C0C5E|nr:helix-turn-helix transcriptional regulator [Flavobacterium selenitireducens]MBD3583506.1 helix-turn-helix transcriptional regulator [Flavobacterium selenitireducens]